MASVIDSLKNSVHKAYITTANSVIGPLKDSKFLEEGVLTPEEFVLAGDLLVQKCATWSWSTGDEKRAVKYLPLDKQFLITKNVPCHIYPISNEKEESVEDGDWLAVGGHQTAKEKEEEIPEIDVGNKKNTKKSDEDDDDDDDEDIPDMETFNEDNNLIQDDVATSQSDKNDAIIKNRTYDLTISYDQYYQTPKVWLFGYDENRQPLPPDQIYKDISQDHAKKTVTLDTHPHLGVSCAFIHPCRHASVMKTMVQKSIDAGKQPRVDQYLFLFLKFLSAVIPSIEYDYTIEIDST
eukprot:TRINITY_DN2935_c0_g1_i1.p1 TRINITY_DN2935_c0_g1~~TRINITY_DN2935_c0_g1_i1.p1  ORF type:complete len:294 (+),score=69.55 TRINITY_DN2935_c0_g1_i1:34-915(+)